MDSQNNGSKKRGNENEWKIGTSMFSEKITEKQKRYITSFHINGATGPSCLYFK
jgi:hypothetical protein